MLVLLAERADTRNYTGERHLVVYDQAFLGMTVQDSSVTKRSAKLE